MLKRVAARLRRFSHVGGVGVDQELQDPARLFKLGERFGRMIGLGVNVSAVDVIDRQVATVSGDRGVRLDQSLQDLATTRQSRPAPRCFGRRC